MRIGDPAYYRIAIAVHFLLLHFIPPFIIATNCQRFWICTFVHIFASKVLFNNSLLHFRTNLLLLFYYYKMVFAIPIQTHFIRLTFPCKFFNRINHSIEHIYTLIKIYHTYKNLTIISQSKYNNKLE